MTYHVYRDYGYTDEVLLGSFEDLEEAVAFANEEAEVTHPDDYMMIEVISFAEDGEHFPQRAFYSVDMEPELF